MKSKGVVPSSDEPISLPLPARPIFYGDNVGYGPTYTLPWRLPLADGRTRILGVDPGSRLCGWGIVDTCGSKVSHVDNGVLVLHSKGELANRLGFLLESLDKILAEYSPQAVAVEGVFQHRNARSALILGHARGVVLASAARRELPVHEYSPMEIKKAVTGSGRSSKTQIQQMIAIRMGLADVPQEDAADAQHSQLQIAPHLQQPRRSRKSAKAALAALVANQERNRR